MLLQRRFILVSYKFILLLFQISKYAYTAIFLPFSLIINLITNIKSSTSLIFILPKRLSVLLIFCLFTSRPTFRSV
jgi:hypothetical protein